MAKRKAPRASGRKKTARKSGAARRKTGGRKSRTARARKAAPKRKRSLSRARKRASSRKAAASSRARKTAARRRVSTPARKARAASSKAPAVARKAAAASRRTPTLSRTPSRKAPALERERRIAREDDIVPTPPSSLDLDRTASAARSGRRELHERFAQHTETSPAVTGGDIDADWESAATVGDEAPGGDNPTPDQDIVDEIGAALGVTYDDNEELKGEKKVSDRDRKRWELDPASSEDYNDR